MHSLPRGKENAGNIGKKKKKLQTLSWWGVFYMPKAEKKKPDNMQSSWCDRVGVSKLFQIFFWG